MTTGTPTSGAPSGLDRFKTRVRQQLVTELYEDGWAYGLPAPAAAAPRRAWRWRLVTAAAAAAVVALALVVAPSLLAPGRGTSDAFAIERLADGTVKVNVKADYKNPEELAERLRDEGLTVRVVEMPSMTPEQVGAVTGFGVASGDAPPAGPKELECHVGDGPEAEGKTSDRKVVQGSPGDAPPPPPEGADSNYLGGTQSKDGSGTIQAVLDPDSVIEILVGGPVDASQQPPC